MNLKFNLLLTCFIATQLLFSQIKAVTENGDTIYVYNNGTWSYEKLDNAPDEGFEFDFLDEKIKIDSLNIKTVFNAKAAKEIQSATGFFKIKYDEDAWKRVPPGTLNDDAELAFEAKNTDVWCVVISEETTIDADKLFKIAKNTMEENTGSEAEILKAEVFNVNGTEVLRGTLKANFSGITFIFDSYYYSNDNGSVQFTTWTSDKIWERSEKDILDFLNGFIVTKK